MSVDEDGNESLNARLTRALDVRGLQQAARGFQGPGGFGQLGAATATVPGSILPPVPRADLQALAAAFTPPSIGALQQAVSIAGGTLSRGGTFQDVARAVGPLLTPAPSTTPLGGAAAGTDMPSPADLAARPTTTPTPPVGAPPAPAVPKTPLLVQPPGWLTPRTGPPAAGDDRNAFYLPDPGQRGIDPVGPGFHREWRLENNAWVPPPGGDSTDDNPRWHEGTPAYQAQMQQFINRGQMGGTPTTRGQAMAALPGSPLATALKEYYRDPAQEAVDRRAALVKEAQGLPPEQQLEAAKKIAAIEIPTSPFQGRTVASPAGPSTGGIATLRGGEPGMINFYNQQQLADQRPRGINLVMPGSNFEWNAHTIAALNQALGARAAGALKGRELDIEAQKAQSEAAYRKVHGAAETKHQETLAHPPKLSPEEIARERLDMAVKADPSLMKRPVIKAQYLPGMLTPQEKLQAQLHLPTAEEEPTLRQAALHPMTVQDILASPLRGEFLQRKNALLQPRGWGATVAEWINPRLQEQHARAQARAPGLRGKSDEELWAEIQKEEQAR